MQNSLARPGVGEIKGKDHAMDKYMSLVDLMRIGLIISKGAIDSNKGILGVYVVGKKQLYSCLKRLSDDVLCDNAVVKRPLCSIRNIPCQYALCTTRYEVLCGNCIRLASSQRNIQHMPKKRSSSSNKNEEGRTKL
ncbi:unnamed protein product [Rhizopus microsporus]